MINKVDEYNKAIAWWSGGVTSAVACKLAIKLFGINNVRVVLIDTNNEDDDTERFKRDCERWYGIPIETISSPEYKEIKEVWYKFNALNNATGAICSSELKREVRIAFQKKNKFSHQVFGFDIDEPKRARNMTRNYPDSYPIYPLLLMGYSKKDCIGVLENKGIRIPAAYSLGFNNNNCLKTGCVQGGIGYWQKMQKDFPEKFDNMAKIEHDLTDRKGQPVTMLKDQSKGGGLVFLKPHPNYPDIKDISKMKGRPPKPLGECNSFCGINDGLPKNETEEEINFAILQN